MTKAYSYIRFSSKKQALGHSRERQLTRTRDYAAEHGLELVEKSFEDLGISAYTGANAAEGALRTFIKGVDDGKIKKGSYLLVESLDRISRQQIMQSNRIFSEIIERGIVLVTLTDFRKYTVDAINKESWLLQAAINEFDRANRESAYKSDRVKRAWGKKRADGRKITHDETAWLKLDPDTREFKPIPDRVKFLRRLFEIAATGLGQAQVHKKLIAEGYTESITGDETKKGNIKKSKSLSPNLVGLHMTDRRLIGEKVNKDGTVDPTFYPKVIDRKLFDLVQQQVASRRPTYARPRLAGPKGAKVSNLLTSLCVCSCGAPMYQYGAQSGKYSYLRCIAARNSRGALCDAQAVPYHRVESALLWWLMEIEEEDLLPSHDQDSRDPRPKIDAELVELDQQLKNIALQSVNMPEVSLILQDRARELGAKKRKLQEERSRYVVPAPVLDQLKRIQETLKKHDALKKLDPLSEDAERIEEVAELRERLRSGLRTIINRIVFPNEAEVVSRFDEPFPWEGYVDDPSGAGKLVREQHFRRMVVLGDIAARSKADSPASMITKVELPDEEGRTEDGLVIEYELPPSTRFS
jgi:DNA invertase Pin-like site-specific DNA recombinase